MMYRPLNGWPGSTYDCLFTRAVVLSVFYENVSHEDQFGREQTPLLSSLSSDMRGTGGAQVRF